MNRKLLITALVLLAIGGGAGFLVSRAISPIDQTSSEREILYWAAPMDPNFRSDKPGKSPMGMDLIPVYKDEAGAADIGEPALQLNPAVINNIGVRTAKVERGDLNRMIDAVGFVEPDDNFVSVLHVRSDGWIERLLTKTEGEPVKEGDTLFQFYSPLISTAQSEYIQALSIGRSANIDAAKQRLISLGMDPEQIDTLRRNGAANRLVDIRAPQDGVILDLNVREGAYVQPGGAIMSLADLQSIWIQVEIFEDQANWVEEGQRTLMRLPFIPGRVWEGVVDYVYPTVDEASRTVRVRLKFPNPSLVLKPGMYAEVSVYGTPMEDALYIPREALIRSGKSERVILSLGQGRFRPARVISGIEVGERVQILAGLHEGENIVISSQFLIDSEASLIGSLLRIETVEPAPDAEASNASGSPDARPAMGETNDATRAAVAIKAVGVVDSVMPAHHMIAITHDPIAALDWPAMTMNFLTPDELDLSVVEPGDKIRFTLTPHDADGYMVADIIVVEPESRL